MNTCVVRNQDSFLRELDLAVWRYHYINTHFIFCSLLLIPHLSITLYRDEPFLAPVGKKRTVKNLYNNLLKKFPTKLTPNNLIMYHRDEDDNPCPHLEEHLQGTLDRWAQLKGVIMTCSVSIGTLLISCSVSIYDHMSITVRCRLFCS